MSWATLPAVPLHLDLEVWESSCSVPKAARDTAGPSTPLRSGRDDNSVAAGIDSTEQSFTSQQNCHPDRAQRSGGTCCISSPIMGSRVNRSFLLREPHEVHPRHES